MTLQEIYSKYKIPPNLIRHQNEVAAVGKYVCTHWKGPKVNVPLIIRTLLLHDLGNISKFKRPFLGELEAQAPYWEGVQQEFLQKYGPTPDEATYAILQELGLLQELAMLKEMKRVWTHPESNLSWEARICEYADCCVTPVAIEGFETRMKDLAFRYGHGQGTGVYEAMRRNAELVEQNVDIDLKHMSQFDWNPILQMVSGEGFDPSTATL